jgi:hypothetical protein
MSVAGFTYLLHACRLGEDAGILLEGAHLPWPGLAQVTIDHVGNMTYERLCDVGRVCSAAELCKDQDK